MRRSPMSLLFGRPFPGPDLANLGTACYLEHNPPVVMR